MDACAGREEAEENGITKESLILLFPGQVIHSQPPVKQALGARKRALHMAGLGLTKPMKKQDNAKFFVQIIGCKKGGQYSGEPLNKLM